MNDKYSVHIVWSEEDSAYIASVRELPGCLADGATQEEALAAVRVVIAEWIETAKEVGRDIPPPVSRQDLKSVAQKFRDSLRAHIQSEVDKAVHAVLQNLPQYSPALVGHDSADFWKHCED